MTDEPTASTTTRSVYPAKVVQVLEYGQKLVINRGRIHGLSQGTKLLVYALSDEEVIDPETKEPLGHLEIVRGRGIVTHLQEKMATVEPEPSKSVSRRIVKRHPAFTTIFSEDRQEVLEEPVVNPGKFEDPMVGDSVKPV